MLKNKNIFITGGNRGIGKGLVKVLGRENNVIFSGIHMSYLKGSIESKNNNSHFIKHFYLRKVLANLGIHPLLRLSKPVNPHYNLTENIKVFSPLEYDPNNFLLIIRNILIKFPLISLFLIFLKRIFMFIF